MPGTQHIMMRYDRHSEWICMQRGALLAAYCNDVLVGAIAVRLERQPSGEVQLYIITLGVLAAYRNYGVGGAFPSLKACTIPPTCLHGVVAFLRTHHSRNLFLQTCRGI